MPEYEGVRGVKKDAIYRLYIIEYMCVIMLGMEASWVVFPEWLLKYFFITKYWNLIASTYREKRKERRPSLFWKAGRFP